MSYTQEGKHRMPALVLALTLTTVQAATAQTITLTAPEQVNVGSQIVFTWTGTQGERDFISMDEIGAPDNTYGPYVYADRGQPAELRAPEVPGRYVIRYHSGASGYAVLGSFEIEVLDSEAVFEELAPVNAGAPVTITWTGPGNARDYISIDEPGSDDRSYGPYAYATKPEVSIRAPDEPGAYIVRYHLGQSYRVIGEVPLTVVDVSATIEAPASTQAGGDIEIGWTGPDNQGDYISIDPAGSADDVYGHYRYTSAGSPLTIKVPIEPGTYEIRYHMGRARTVLTVSTLEVLANTASVDGPPSVAGGSEFDVAWEGPDNHGDYLTIVPLGAGNREYLSYAYTARGTPLTLLAPLEIGSYELRYITGQGRMILASASIEVTPGVVPGKLRVTGATEGAGAMSGPGAVEVILDASGSMLQRLDGAYRIEIAKAALDRLVREVLPAETLFALRVFGNREASSCRTDLEIATAPLQPVAAAARIGEIQPQSLARTPIGASLLKVKEDLAGVTGPTIVVLLTDGEETCGGDPRAAIEALKAAGFDVRVNIVGFAIDELQLKEQFEEWARAGNGRYIEANNAEQLDRAVVASMDVSYEVLRGDEVVATGVVNGDPLTLAPGTYRVRLLSSQDTDLGDVTIEPRGEHHLEVK